MAIPIVRNLSDEVHCAQHGQSMEAEVREMLESAISPKGRMKLGSLLAEIGQEAGLSDEEFADFEQVRDKSSARFVGFE